MLVDKNTGSAGGRPANHIAPTSAEFSQPFGCVRGVELARDVTGKEGSGSLNAPSAARGHTASPSYSSRA